MSQKKEKSIIRILCLILSFVKLSLVFSQSQISFRQLSVKEGLSQNSAISISQDSTGYLWIATQDGLNKYDGREFISYPYNFIDITKPDYSNLGKVYTDRQGTLWMIPIDKIPRKLNTKTHSFEAIKGVDDSSVIFQDKLLNLWIGTYGKGLFLVDPNDGMSKRVISAQDTNGPIYNITEDVDGTLILLGNQQIVEYNKGSKTIKKIRFENSFGKFVNQNFSDIICNEFGDQWIATFGDGLYFRKKGENQLRRVPNNRFGYPLPDNLNITDLYLDSKKRLWVATYGLGLYLLDFETDEIQHFGADIHDPKALHYNDVLCIHEDYSGTLWFGTDGGGISYFDEYLEKFNSLTKYQTPENIHIDVVRSIAVDRQKTVWIGTSGYGLTQYLPESNSWRTFRSASEAKSKISSDRVMSLLTDDNSLWVGTQGGGLNLLNLDLGKFENFNHLLTPTLSAETVWDIYKDNTNQIWLGTREQGLVLFDKEKGEIKKYKHSEEQKNTVPSNNIRVITQDFNGLLWVGTEADGLASFDIHTEIFKTYQNLPGSNSLSNNGVKSIYPAANGMLWIGTNGGGLNVLDTKKNYFYSYTTDDGLANNVIYSILPDRQGNLWLSSNKGITKFTPRNNVEDAPIIVNYNNYDGLATEFNTGAYFADAKGNLYFGGLDGFYWFNPDEIKENNILPKTTITGLEVLDKPQLLEKNLQLAADRNTLTFRFSSLQYSLPEKNKYRYKLTNYDEDWVQAGNTNFARYTQLPPGKYEFQVVSSNYDEVWNEQPVTFGFAIAPPWYLTNMAKIGYLLLFLTSIFAVYRYFKWRWKMRLSLKLNEEEALRLKKLNDFKTKLYTDISHEFRTPLTLISGSIDSKLGEGRLSDDDFSNFSMIKRNTQRLIGLVDQLLHLAKLEKGKLKLKIAQGDLGLFLGMITKSFEFKAESKSMDYKVQIANLKEVWYDEDAIEKIVTNLLSNALKYGKNGGVCQFEADQKEDKIYMSIKNTVENRSDIDLEKLFTRFYQQNEYAEGAGVGLSLVKELVQLYQGEISVGMEADNIHFKVMLPLDKEGVQDAEIMEPLSKLQLVGSKAAPNVAAAGQENFKAKANADDLPILLIVEDHKEVRKFLGSVWKNHYRVITATNGKEGIAKALETVPDLIITDVRMPICDGITLCNTLKTDERTSHIPIILLTAGIGEEQELRGLHSGADDFITKPFKLRVLQQRVENLITTRKALRSRYSQEVILKAKDIAITPTDEVFLNRLQHTLDEHLSDTDCNAASLCKKLGMSRMQLHRKLLAFSGLSTTAFIRSQRLKQAVHILKTSDASINEVAYTVGFNTPSYFIKCFKAAYKKTPAEYLQAAE